MKNFIKVVFKNINTSYLIKHYFFSGLLYGGILFFTGRKLLNNMGALILLTISFLLYPFAMFVYDSVLDTLQGKHILISVNSFILVTWVGARTFLIFCLSILIAPFGILYLYLSGRRNYN